MSVVTDTKHATAPVTLNKTLFRMIRTSNVRDGHLLISGMDTVEESTYEKWSERIHLRAGDIVFSREAPIGEVAIIPDDINKYFLGQRMVAIRLNTQNDSRFILNTFLTSTFKKEVYIRNTEATTVANFGIPILKKHEIEVPVLHEQVKIGQLFGAIDSLIAANEQVLKLVIKIVKNSLTNSLLFN